MATEFATVEVRGRPLRCNVCDNATFWQHEVQLPTSVFSFLDAAEWNGAAQCAICERCGFMHWFAPPGAARERESPEDPQPDGAQPA